MNPTFSLENLFTTFWQIYTQSHAKLGKNFPSALMEIREKAIQAFKKNRLPNSKTEAYRYTPFLPDLSMHFTQKASLPTDQPTHDLAPQMLQDVDAYHILLHNGKLIPNPTLEKKLPKNLHILPLWKAYPTYHTIIDTYFAQLAIPDKDSFIALNTMLFDQGTFIYLTPGTKLDKPLILHHLTQAGAGTTLHPRLLVVLGKHSSLQFVETFCRVGQSSIFMNRVAEIVLEPHAQLEYYHLQPKELSPSLQMHYTHIHQKVASTLHHYTFTLDGRLARNHLEVALAEPQSRAHLYGMYTGHSNNYTENHTVIDHRAPYTTSHQLYKGIAQQAATGVFRGSIHVQKPAQKAQASQKHHAWLLSPKASIKTQPRLAIQADDVQCMHGATISQPDPNQLFYLSTRGISQKVAHNILLQGFFKKMINTINLLSLRKYLNQSLSKVTSHEFI